MVIIACIFFLLAIAAFVISLFSFLKKGFLFNNAYIYASKEERQRMDKKPYYRQSAIVFSAVSIVMLLLGVGILIDNFWFISIAILLAAAALVFAIASDKK